MSVRIEAGTVSALRSRPVEKTIIILSWILFTVFRSTFFALQTLASLVAADDVLNDPISSLKNMHFT